MKRILTRYFNSWWLPALVYLCLLGSMILMEIQRWVSSILLFNILFFVASFAFIGLIVASIWNLIKKRWLIGVVNILFVFGCGFATVLSFALMFAAMFGPSEDCFADNLTIPEGIEIDEPEQDASGPVDEGTIKETDEFQESVRKALTIPGNGIMELTPSMPSLRKASTDYAQLFRDYIEASPDWHVFMEQGNRFAARHWSYNGEPRDELHGYISDFFTKTSFQTRCLFCLDCEPWSTYSVQHVIEGTAPVIPEMSQGNNLHESRLMIECGGVWVEIFEQSNNPERRVTKATIAELEKEFSAFVQNPQDALAQARSRSHALALRLAGSGDHPFRLLEGMQPGIYGVTYSLNPGEPGSVYLKAFEVTKGIPLSVDRLAMASRTRMTWSADSTERFGAKAGFTIYEGDWGKPYAARFEVWFIPDSGKAERKLAERIFKIEGWMR